MKELERRRWDIPSHWYNGCW